LFYRYNLFLLYPFLLEHVKGSIWYGIRDQRLLVLVFQKDL